MKESGSKDRNDATNGMSFSATTEHQHAGSGNGRSDGDDHFGRREIITPSQVFTGARIPVATEVVDVVAIQRGTSDPDRVIVITGHHNSRASNEIDSTIDAPGANDDASSVAAVIEAARVLSKHKFAATALSGEEQGLYGGKVLAAFAKEKGWRVEANPNNDIVGNTLGLSGVRDNVARGRVGDTIEFVDFPYLAQVTRLNVLAMASMANAPPPPSGVAVEGAVSPNTTLRWQPQPGVAYRAWWRGTTDPMWQYQRPVGTDDAKAGRIRLDNIVIDDWFFGVSSISSDGWESPVVFPGDPGSF